MKIAGIHGYVHPLIPPTKNGTYIGSDHQICFHRKSWGPWDHKPTNIKRAMKHALLGHGTPTEETNILSLWSLYYPTCDAVIPYYPFTFRCHVYEVYITQHVMLPQVFTFRFHVCFPGCCSEKAVSLVADISDIHHSCEQDPKNSKIHQGHRVVLFEMWANWHIGSFPNLQ